MVLSLMPALNNTRFRMMCSTSSAVSPTSPTEFIYYEQEGLVWGKYAGDTVDVGRLVGTRRGDSMEITFAHVERNSRNLVTGSAHSVITRRAADGLLLLEETYEMHGRQQKSMCIQVLEGARDQTD